MKAQTLKLWKNLLVGGVLIFGLVACGDEENSKDNGQPNINTIPTTFGSPSDFNDPTLGSNNFNTGTNGFSNPGTTGFGGGFFNGGAPQIQVTGPSTPTSINVAPGQPVNVSFNITNVANPTDVQMILKNNPGGQLVNTASLNPSFNWQFPTQGTHSVTLLVRNNSLCSQQLGLGQCQLNPNTFMDARFDAEQTIVINVGTTGGFGFNNNPNGFGFNNPNTGFGVNNPNGFFPNNPNGIYPNNNPNGFYPNNPNGFYPNNINGFAGDPQAAQIFSALGALGVDTSQLYSLQQLYTMAQGLGLLN